MSDAKTIFILLRENYREVKYYLDFSTPLELLVAAILAPQVKDAVVNSVTPALFRKYKTARQYAEADLEELAEDIEKISFPNQKAKRIKETCSFLHEKYNGAVPETLEELMELPGIGRKTANAILINAFDKVIGIPVDTHVIRVSQRMGFSDHKDPDKIEKDLMSLFPQDQWKVLPWLLKKHGQTLCKALTPACGPCFLSTQCPKNGVTAR